MVTFTINVAGLAARVTAQFDSTRDYCRLYLTDEQPQVSLHISPADIAAERKGELAPFSEAYLETIALQRQLTEALFHYDTLLFHGSVVAVDGAAYLFTATSGTGKSTHTRLWRQVLGDRAVMVNDDKPYLRLTDTGALACGSPWNGKHRLGSNIQVPLEAICILERAPENHIRPITPREALLMLLQQSARPRDPAGMPKYMELADRLAGCVRFYRMGCNMEPAAAEMAYEAMRKDD